MMEPIRFGAAFDHPEYPGVRQCKVYRGPHHVADIQHAGPNYFVMGLYWGTKIVKTQDRARVKELAEQQTRRAPLNPRDCDASCQHA